MAINSVQYNGRPACVYDGWCDAGCPILALGNPLTVYLPRAFRAGAEIINGSAVTRVLTNQRGDRATGVEYYDAQGQRQVQEAGLVILAAYAFETVMGPIGRWIVTLTVTLFAFSTIISWSYYGEQGITFIFGEKHIPKYRYVFIVFIFIGAITHLNIVLNVSDAVYGLLAIPNMIACYMLLPKVKAMLADYTRKLKSGEIKAFK